GAQGGLVVATTRPETMLGDTAVAVNPGDERYLELTTERVELPLMAREIPIIRDPYVDLEFGTGALKVTPAHDPNDFEIGQRHGLPNVKVIGDDGLMTAEAGAFAGQDRFACRRKVVEALKEQGLLEKIEPLNHSVGHCYRCKTVVEPNLSTQWFVKVKPLAAKAIEAVEAGHTKIIPPNWTQTYYDWMHNIRDWCISRQIWWGHRIPAWTCQDCDEIIVAMEAPEVCRACNSRRLVRETDVLDTWFSSALWPFSTMGWPEQTPLLKTFYPTATLVTGFDILFFWVARMMMMGLQFMDDVPFRDVYVHALVRDEDGKKMSKSKGNVIDPLNVIEAYGTDAFRFTLTAFAAQGRDIKMSEKRVEGYRHFINKLWNAARFAGMHLNQPEALPPAAQLAVPDRWILSRMRTVIEETAAAIDGYRFNEAAALLYQFVWHEFCDWYLELSKPALYGNQGEEKAQAARGALWRVMHDMLILLHPLIPFVTEEIWSQLPGTQDSIMRATYPADNDQLPALATDREAEAAIATLMQVITGIRNIRGEMNIAPSLKLAVALQSDDGDIRRVVAGHEDLVINLARLEQLSVAPTGEKPKASATAVIDNATLYVSLEGIIDLQQEAARLRKEIAKVAAELEKLDKKLNNADFLNKAPENVVAKVKDKHAGFAEKSQALASHLERIQALAEEG
ncbi:MAG: valine--tRNA ligase, partial [Desulfobacterales bacterium]|nr:valine--tRNA ligase [Desulfobacterales bacterium]